MERQAQGRGGGALSRLGLVVGALLGAGCLVRGAMPDGPDAPALPPTIADVVRCATGTATFELSGWRRSVARVALGRWSDATLEAATLTCRLVPIAQRPVVSGTNAPVVMTLVESELELSVELHFSRVTPACVRQRWLGRSRWRVVPLESDDVRPTPIVEEAFAALEDAARLAEPSAEVRIDCPRL
ncbi:MAG: hypothetical protein SFW67_01730 [Myxococcaceae bacterium]|nr:hypothetical protein [Myxococcaceae bacterium]